MSLSADAATSVSLMRHAKRKENTAWLRSSGLTFDFALVPLVSQKVLQALQILTGLLSRLIRALSRPGRDRVSNRNQIIENLNNLLDIYPAL